MEPQEETPDEEPSLRVESSAFATNGQIPQQFTADGDDISPPLTWSGAPEGTAGFAIVVEDPDAFDPEAPAATFVHWIVTGIPGSITSLEAGELPEPAVEGTNSYGNQGWDGPSPSVGRHRYVFKVYALDVQLDAAGITWAELFGTMNRHVLAKGELIGTYEKARERRSAKRAGERRHPGHRPSHPDRH